MEKRTDVLIVGGGPAGVVSAITAKKYYPEKDVLVMKDVKDGVIPCGIPYMFESLKNPAENRLSNTSLEQNNIGIVIDKVINIDKKEKYIKTANGDKYFYEKLILAVGSVPINLPIKGIDKKRVYFIHKELGYLKNVVDDIKKCKKVLVIGGGFIGVEFADELSKIEGLSVILVEMLPRLFANSFDPDFSLMAEECLKEKGVEILTSTQVEEIIGDNKVEKVRFRGGKTMDVDAVILGVGSKPNVELAINADLDLGYCKGILVDEYGRVPSSPDIFAIGDCSCKKDFYTRKDIPVMLASTATAEARIAGANLYQIKVVRENKGTIAIYSTYISGLVLGSAGLTESTALKEGFEIVVGVASGVDKHPGTLPGASQGKVKLIFSKQSGIILGGQISCGMSCAQAINIIGVAIQKRMSATELETLQIATHPYLTSAPTMYPIILAAQNVCSRIKM